MNIRTITLRAMYVSEKRYESSTSSIGLDSSCASKKCKKIP